MLGPCQIPKRVSLSSTCLLTSLNFIPILSHIYWFTSVIRSPVLAHKSQGEFHLQKNFRRTSCSPHLMGQMCPTFASVLLEILALLPVLICLGCRNKVHKLVGLNNRNLFSHISSVWKSKVLAGLLPPEAFSFGLFTTTLSSHWVLIWPFLFILCVSVVSSSSWKDSNHLDWAPTLMTSFNFFI